MIDLLTILAIVLFAAAAMSDLRWRRIPNMIPCALAALGLLRLAILAPGWASSGLEAAIALAIFTLGAAAFHRGLLGGGDVKLLAAGGVWLGADAVASFLLLTALAGGILALVWIMRRSFAPPICAEAAALPYGVAIAAGGILAMTFH